MTIFLFLIDRLLKYLVKARVIEGIVNQSLFWWLIDNQLLLGINLLMLLGLFIWWLKTKKPAVFLILLGGVSNVIDRFFLGGVIDYLKSPVFNFNFNLADVMIVFGCVWFVTILLKAKK